MPIRRVFCDWKRPGLLAAVDYLAATFGAPSSLDLEGVIVALPGQRAGRRLIELLVERAERDDLVLRPPRILTLGELPERLYERKRPFADSFVQQLAWIRAMRHFSPEELRLFTPAAPAGDDLVGWLGLGGVLARLHRELAADGLDFDAVAERGSKAASFCEERRWRMLAQIQRKYLEILDGVGLWDVQTARLVAILQRECRTDARIVLVGTADMNRSQKLMLDQVADQVTALVFAPEALSPAFDEHGCLRPEAWHDVKICVADEQIEIAGSPSDQAAAVLRAIAALGGRYCAEQIAIGVPDEQIVPYLEQQLGQYGIAARFGPGLPLTQSAPYRLLSAAADYLDDRRFSALAALVRHPAVDEWLVANDFAGDWISALDAYYSQHFPQRLGDCWLEKESKCELLKRLCAAMTRLLAEFRGDKRPLDEWCEPIRQLLLEMFGRTLLDTTSRDDRRVLAACETIGDVLRRHAAIPAELMPMVTAPEAIRLVLRQAAGERIAPPADRKSIELLGWLELPLDDAPALIVSGVNEGIVPSSLNGDMFLPNQLRRALDLEDNHRRYARDCYALSVLAASRESLKLIAGRRSADGEPLIPSRLLFACEEQIMARRAVQYFSRPPRVCGPSVPGGLRPAERARFEPPPPRPLDEPVRCMRVTEFRDYIACPYRYYLRHRLGLKSIDDAAEELDESAFGSLLHEVLRRFGTSPVADSVNADKIADSLNEALDAMVAQLYGAIPLPVIRVQVEQLRARLAGFARWQADWTAQGWRIEHCECQPADGKAVLEVDGESMVLRGRIDRIDIHEESKRRTIFDYKSSSAGKSPDQTHRRGGQWIDLQLPLYRHLARGMEIEGPFDLGYIVLPKDPGGVGHRMAEWSQDDLEAADCEAERIVREIRAGKFLPITTPAPEFFEEFAAICQDGRLDAGAFLDGGADDA